MPTPYYIRFHNEPRGEGNLTPRNAHGNASTEAAERHAAGDHAGDGTGNHDSPFVSTLELMGSEVDGLYARMAATIQHISQHHNPDPTGASPTAAPEMTAIYRGASHVSIFAHDSHYRNVQHRPGDGGQEVVHAGSLREQRVASFTNPLKVGNFGKMDPVDPCLWAR